MKTSTKFSLIISMLALTSTAGLFAQAPGNIVRGYTFEFTFEESEGVAPDVDTLDEYLVVTRTNDRGERVGLMDGEDYLWDYVYGKIPPSGAEISLEVNNPPDQSEIPEEEREPYYVTQSFVMAFDNPFEGTFTYTVTNSDDETGTASGSFLLVRGPWKDIVQDPESGWANVNWYGNVYVINYPWCYSQDEGWVYISAEEEADMWQYREGVEWHWTAEGTFPWCYDAEEGRWLYLYTDDPESDVVIFFIGGTDEVIIVPKT